MNDKRKKLLFELKKINEKKLKNDKYNNEISNNEYYILKELGLL